MLGRAPDSGPHQCASRGEATLPRPDAAVNGDRSSDGASGQAKGQDAKAAAGPKQQVVAVLATGCSMFS